MKLSQCRKKTLVQSEDLSCVSQHSVNKSTEDLF